MQVRPPGSNVHFPPTSCSAAFRLINYGAHTDGALSWVKNVRRAGGRRSYGVAYARWNVRRAGGRRSDGAFSPLSVVRAFGDGCAFRVGCDRGTGSRLASRIEPVPLSACICIRKILRVRAGLSSAGTRARTGRYWSAGLRHGVVAELAPETIGAPASGTASLLNSHQKPLERRPPARRRC
jgi:hypothetical protein